MSRGGASVGAVETFVVGLVLGAAAGALAAIGVAPFISETLRVVPPAVSTQWVMPLERGTYSVGCGMSCYPGHTGQDFAAAAGTPLRSSNAGRVVRSESLIYIDGQAASCPDRPICGSQWRSYGNLIVIADAADPAREIYYAHLSRRYVAVGDQVNTGQLIGAVGDVGNSKGPHLHYETRINGAIADPLVVLREKGVQP
jgi:murein DD-endopeptidase MepM/ murein hydrolase activator NlpD